MRFLATAHFGAVNDFAPSVVHINVITVMTEKKTITVSEDKGQR